MADPIKQQAIKALSWSFVQELGLRALQLGVSIALTRLLSPKEFGLVAMLTVFIGLAQALVDGGFVSALIQAKQPTEAHKSSVFYFNICGSLLLAAILWVAAPWIAGFYGQALLKELLRALALLPVINSFGLVQNTLLIRNLEVKKQTIIFGASTVVSGIVAVTLGWRGFGVWSLVCYQLIQSLMRTLLLWMLNDWRPQRKFSLEALGEMFRFGWGMLCSVILSSTYDNLYPLLIGKFFKADSLGYFNRAQSLQTVASQGLSAVASRVTFPVFATMQDDLVRFRTNLRKAVITITFVQFPMMIGLAVVAKPLILLVFSAKWAASIPYLQLLAFAGMLYPLHVLNLNVLTALGRSDLFFRLEVFKVTIFLTTGLLTFHWGVMALIWGQIFCDIAGYFLNSYYTKRLIDYSIWQQFRDFFPCLAASICMGLLVVLVGAYLPPGNVVQLGCRVFLGAAAYFVICWSLRLAAMGQLWSIIWRQRVAANNPA